MCKRLAIVAVFALTFNGALPAQAGAAFATEVTQLLNHAQLVMQYIRQGTQLTNELNMYSNMMRNSQPLSVQTFGSITNDLNALATIVQGGQALAYSMGNLDQLFRQTYPGYGYNSGASYLQYRNWSQTSLDTTLGTLRATGLPDRVVVRQPAYSNSQAISTAPEQTPEERKLAAAYQRELDAMAAPTGIRSASAASSFSPLPPTALPTATDDLARIAALTQNITGRDSGPPGAASLNRVAALEGGSAQRNDPDYDAQNNQGTKSAFYYSAQQQKTDDYLKSTRTAPISPYEIKAGWEIPAVLEQNLNSDLSGEIKALITSNVFDTATGRYLLIPQGARLVGKYDSRVSYGQDGVQVVWDRIIFPDASSVDINGMAGLDAHGNSGLRYDVDHHYKRLLGFTALTSAFEAAFDLSQRNTQSALTYPSVTDTASASVGRDISETGASITRRNLNVQPTIKVPGGYKFTVRVNRDILFDAPYQPLQANPLPGGTPGQLHPRTAFPISDPTRR